jgi:hypothetical protein
MSRKKKAAAGTTALQKKAHRQDRNKPELDAVQEAAAAAAALPLVDLTLDPRIQARDSLDQDAVTEYCEAMLAGDVFPPIVVYKDREDRLWVSDGFHRVEAARRNDPAGTIHAVVRSGEFRDAQLAAIGANTEHGLRRTNADKRKAIGMLLGDPEWCRWSDHEISRRCGVSQPFVGNMRVERGNEVASDNGYRMVTRGGTTYQMDTTNIGAATAEPEPEHEPELEAAHQADEDTAKPPAGRTVTPRRSAGGGKPVDQASGHVVAGGNPGFLPGVKPKPEPQQQALPPDERETWRKRWEADRSFQTEFIDGVTLPRIFDAATIMQRRACALRIIEQPDLITPRDLRNEQKRRAEAAVAAAIKPPPSTQTSQAADDPGEIPPQLRRTKPKGDTAGPKRGAEEAHPPAPDDPEGGAA